MSRSKEIEGLVLLLDVGSSMTTKLPNSSTSYLQSCADTIQMIVQRKMFQTSKDELALVLFGTNETANVLWDGESDHYRHVTVARQLAVADWKLLEFVQNKLAASNLDGDVLDGLVVASNHFHEDANRLKFFKDKRIIIFTDFSSNIGNDDELKSISSGLAKEEIRVDIISPFNDDDIEQSKKHHSSGKGAASSNGSDRARSSRDATNDRERKVLTRQQLETLKILEQICEKTEGAMYSFDEALTLLSHYQSKAVKSTGTKYTLTIGTKFRMPIVSMIKCKENKPEVFRFKRVYAKDENVELKTDRARFTKDEEQRDLDDKNDVVDAYKYGSTYVPIDADSDALKLKVEKCFSLLGFTKSKNIKRSFYLGDSVQQILPDPAAGDAYEDAFVNMVHAMYREDCYGIVRRVFSSRSSPELGCLIPYITAELACLFYTSLPFDDDIRRFTLDNFSQVKPTEKQSKLVDDLMDSMDLSGETRVKKENDDDGEKEEEEEEELYDPHLTFNPYIQRMFQAIALRGTNPTSELPDFDKHITSLYLSRLGARVSGSERTQEILKRIADEFPLRSFEKKAKTSDEDGATKNIFEKKKTMNGEDEESNKENAAGSSKLNATESLSLNDILDGNLKKIKNIGTVNPVEDFKHLADRISLESATCQDELEELCIQIQGRVNELFKESLQQAASSLSDDDPSALLFQQKAADCIRVMREYCVRRSLGAFFNSYLRTFKVYLINEVKSGRQSKLVEAFWKKHFANDVKMSLITDEESLEPIGVHDKDAREFSSSLVGEDNSSTVEVRKVDENKESVEDLLDMM